LQEWGEIGIVTDHAKNKINAKLDYKGRPCMLVNYAENHQSDVYRMWDLKTRRIVIRLDILWLNKIYGDFIHDKKTAVDNAINDNELHELEEPQNTTTGRVEDHNQDQNNNADDEGIQDYHVDEHEEHEDMQEMLQEVQETTQEMEPTSTSTRRTRSSRTSDNRQTNL
jgi:hypothetical protein